LTATIRPNYNSDQQTWMSSLAVSVPACLRL